MSADDLCDTLYRIEDGRKLSEYMYYFKVQVL